MKSKGFTLVEVMIVIAIITIIVSIATLNFRGMKGKADTEKQTLQLQSDITNVRLNAMQNKQRSIILFGPRQHIYRTYTSAGQPVADGTEVNSVSYPFEIRKLEGSSTLSALDSNVDRIEFDSRGYTNNAITFVVTPVTYSGGLDCIEVQTARTSIGRMENVSTCRKQ